MEPKPRQLSIIGFILVVTGLLAACVKPAQVTPTVQTSTMEEASMKTVTLTPERKTANYAHHDEGNTNT